jgi:hypothetical protein
MTDRLPRTQLRVLLAIMALRASAPPADPITCRSLALACGLRSIGHLHAVLAGLRARGLIASEQLPGGRHAAGTIVPLCRLEYR